MSGAKMGKLIDLTGQRFGRLTVVARDYTDRNRNIYWKCQCDCGNECFVRGDHLKRGQTRSCGCFNAEVSSKRHKAHGLTGSRLFNIWVSMRQRCNNPRDQAYNRYGGRGITVCDEWKDNFQVFYSWAISNGYAPGLSIDRIDNDKGYCPENCRWATSREQARNRRGGHLITFQGETLTMVEWAEKMKIPLHVLSFRITRYNWPVWRALTEPLHTEKGRKTKSKKP